MNALVQWQNFYIVVGSAAGALTGLQFVVMALMADTPVTENAIAAMAAFSTPSVVSFGVVLALAAINVMPWNSLRALPILWSAAGVVGLAYTGVTAMRIREQDAYRPVVEDWFFRIVVPAIAYGALAAAILMARSHPALVFFQVAAAVLLLLFLGIHQAWDNAIFLVARKLGKVEQ